MSLGSGFSHMRSLGKQWNRTQILGNLLQGLFLVPLELSKKVFLTGIMMGFHGRIFHGWKPAHSSLSIPYFNVSSVENKENHHDIKTISLWPVVISNSLDSAICFVLEVKHSCCG